MAGGNGGPEGADWVTTGQIAGSSPRATNLSAWWSRHTPASRGPVLLVVRVNKSGPAPIEVIIYG